METISDLKKIVKNSKQNSAVMLLLIFFVCFLEKGNKTLL